MFSALPVPAIGWNEKNMRYMLAAFPLIGAVIGGIEAVWVIIASKLALPQIMTAAVVAAIPPLVTGGIHLDGYADVCDALSSYGDAGKRREILEDPHIGAFAAIRLGIYFVLSFGFASGLKASGWQMLLLGCSFVVSRCLSGLAVSILPLSKDTGLAHTFKNSADKKKTALLLEIELLTVSLIMLAGGYVLEGTRGIASAALMLLCAAGVFLYLRKTANDKFCGLSGDLNGWFLEKAELWMLAALVLAAYIYMH